MLNRFRFLYLLFAAVSLSIGTVACDDSNDSDPISGVASVSVNIRVATTVAAGPPQKVAIPVSLTRVRLLVEEMELESVLEDSADFEIGPVVVDLELSGQPTQVGDGAVPVGVYDELEFEVDQLEDDDDYDASDPVFADFLGTDYSIIIEGSYDTSAFTLNIDQDFEQEKELLPPLTIDSATTSANITLAIDLESWFLDSDGVTVLDPRDPGNLSQIKNNIAGSFEAFEDDDNDGGLEFESTVVSVDLETQSFVLEGGLEVFTDESTVFEGDITDLATVKDLLNMGKEIEADGEAYRTDDNFLLATEVEFEEEEED